MAADRDRGFTLVEVVVAIVLVGILSSVVVVGVGQLTNRGTSASCAASQDAARAAATVHFGSTGSYPTTFTQMTSGSSPALTLPAGATVNAAGDAVTAGGWTLELVRAPGQVVPTFICAEALWTPAQLAGVALWLDAEDASTITSNGSTVSEWRDKSGSTRHAVQATATHQPTYLTNSVNGLPVLTFDGSNDRMTTTLSASASSETIIGVFRANAGGIRTLIGSSGSGGRQFRVSSGRLEFIRQNLALVAASSGTVPVDTAFVVGLSYDATTTRFFANGASVGDTTVNPNLTPGRTSTLGVHQDGADTHEFLSGAMAEVVITSSVLSVDERQRLEGYLAHKWGLAGSLPAGHPFRSEPPTP